MIRSIVLLAALAPLVAAAQAPPQQDQQALQAIAVMGFISQLAQQVEVQKQQLAACQASKPSVMSPDAPKP